MTGASVKMAAIEAKAKRSGNLEDVKPGDSVRVHYKIVEGDKERVQVFAGVVIRIHRGGVRSTLTVRKMSYGVGVERIFPMNSPRLEKITLTTRGRVRRSRLYYLRGRTGKAARIREDVRSRADALPDDDAGTTEPAAEES